MMLVVNDRFLILISLILISITRLVQCSEPWDNTFLSCAGASFAHSPSPVFCDGISWRHALLYSNTNNSMYNPSIPLSPQEQTTYAKDIYDSLVRQVLIHGDDEMGEGDAAPSCKDAMRKLACVTAFPFCGYSSPAVGYLSPCALQCLQVNSQCPHALNCGMYPSLDCAVQVPSGYFIPDPIQVHHSFIFDHSPHT